MSRQLRIGFKLDKGLTKKKSFVNKQKFPLWEDETSNTNFQLFSLC